MELIWYYLIFAVSTGLVNCIFLLAPVIALARAEGVRNVFTYNTKIAYTVYFFISTLIAPLTILPILVDSVGARFREGLARTILAEDPEI